MTALALAGVLAAGACGGNDNKADAKPEAKAAHESAGANKAKAGSGGDFCADAKTLYDQLTAAGAKGPTRNSTRRTAPPFALSRFQCRSTTTAGNGSCCARM